VALIDQKDWHGQPQIAIYSCHSKAQYTSKLQADRIRFKIPIKKNKKKLLFLVYVLMKTFLWYLNKANTSAETRLKRITNEE